MPKKDFAQELKTEFGKGNLKPSQIRRSKSTEELTVPKAIPLTKSKSAEEITSLQPSLSEQVKQLKQDLIFSQTTAQNYLQRLQSLEAEMESKETEIKELKRENNALVDKNNELRLQALKWDDQLKASQQQITSSATHFTTLTQQKINLQVQNSQLLREKSDLETRLKTANERIQKLYQLKGLPHTTTNSPWPLKTIFLTSLLVGAIYWLSKA